MRLRRLITAVTVIAFLPIAAGCSKTSVVTGETVLISGYSRPDDGFREWEGTVQVIDGD